MRSNGSTFTATLHYPAISSAADAPFDTNAAPCPGITFGHGFVQPVTQYTSTLRHLATHGFLVIASQSEGSLFPNHGNFAKDMRFCLDWLEQQNADAGSAFFNGVDTGRFGASGHSMGGGCSILASKDDPRIDALAPLAAANTNPSSINAMLDVAVPVRLVAGSQDGIVATDTNSAVMYANADAPKQLQVIQGGFHCGFTDGDFLFCDSGSITRAAQLAITRRLLTEFFLLHLKLDQSTWKPVWGTALPDETETVTARDAGSSVVVRPTPLGGIPGVRALASVRVTNNGPIASSYTLIADPSAPAGWSISFAPAKTPNLAAGQGAVVTLVATGPLDAGVASLLVTAQRAVDGATRAYTSLDLEPTMPTPDINGDGTVDGADLGVMLAEWGPGPSAADLNEDGFVDGADLGVLLATWE